MRPADDAARRIDEAEDREAGDRLARAGFADQPEDFAARDLEADAVHRLDDALLGEEMRVEVFDLRVGPFIALSSALQPRVQHFAQAVADDVDAEDESDEQRGRDRR